MSLQELDTGVNSAPPASTEISTAKPQAPSSTGSLLWFQRAYPQFFKPKIIANRSKDLAGECPPAKKSWQSVGRKIEAGKTTNIALHFDQKNQSFYFRCLSDEVRLLIDIAMLQNATAAVKGSEWVRIKAGAKVLCLNRLSLRAAFNKLKP